MIMNSIGSYLKSEQGSGFLIIIILLLAIISLTTIAALVSSTTETQIVRNEQIYQKNYYRSEAAAIEATIQLNQQIVENLQEHKTADPNFLVDNSPDSDTPIVLSDISNWDISGGTDNNCRDVGFLSSSHIQIPVNTTIRYSAAFQGSPNGSELTMTGAKMHQYAVYGYCTSPSGSTLIELGFRMKH